MDFDETNAKNEGGTQLLYAENEEKHCYILRSTISLQWTTEVDKLVRPTHICCKIK